MATKPSAADDRKWQQAVDCHVLSILSSAVNGSPGHGVVVADDLDGRPTLEIMGPDGVWRRYLVRLTEAPKPLPFDPADLQAMRS
jgi:hypothetical protein